MNRRKFLNIVGCCGCSYIINSCASVPITDRKQLNLIPEAKLNAQAAQIYEKVKKKQKNKPTTVIHGGRLHRSHKNRKHFQNGRTQRMAAVVARSALQ